MNDSPRRDSELENADGGCFVSVRRLAGADQIDPPFCVSTRYTGGTCAFMRV